ncbi:MAG: hypothetical protein HOC05_21170 [Gemmatimonadetes bacterium]|nr:hypothetical protein [Gemmatimonadota bacterium]MBT5145988.1 hypothetical protein [Gemmatimonadota bacterium]
MQIGVARADITPPIGIEMIGFAGRDPSFEIHDALHATAMAVSEGQSRSLLFTLDLLQLSAATVARLRQRIAIASGVPASQITLACTHNHYGPAVEDDTSDLVAAYREHLGHVLAGIGGQAIAALQPARLGLGWGQSDIGINRREWHDGRIVLGNNPEGPVDHSVGLVRIETTDRRPLATLLNYACHPVSQRGQMAAISADFPGRATALVAQLTGAPCLYLQGACGDVNPVRMESSYEPARSQGVRLGCEAVRLWETIETEEVEGLASKSQVVELPAYRYGSAAAAAQLVDELRQDISDRTQTGDTDSGPLWWAQHRLEKSLAAVESWRSGSTLPCVEAEVSAIQFGPLALATAPGEIFTEDGQTVKQSSVSQHTFFLGYTNGSIGYVPTRAAYAEGGYEVTHACRVDPEAGEMITDACRQLLSTIAAGQ